MIDTKTTNAPTNGAQPPASVRIKASVIDAVEVSVEAYLGAARTTVAELGRLGKGDVVTLDAALNTAVELRLNGVCIGRGELVAVGDHFAVRITEIAA